MLRRFVARPVLLSSRSFSAVSSAMAAGDTGSPKTRGSLAGKDAFARREEASENYYVRQHEKEKLEALRAKVKDQEKHLQDLKDHIKDFTKDQGGEKN